MTKKASPLGRWVSRLTRGRGDDERNKLLDGELGRKLEAARRRTSHRSELRGWALRRWKEARGRRLLALVCIVAESHRRGRSAGRRMCQVEIARRLGCSTKSVQRDMRALARAGVWDYWQPDASQVPDWMRGRAREDGTQWAYTVVRWLVKLPAAIQTALERWRTPRALTSSPAPSSSRELEAPPSRYGSEAERAAARERGAALLLKQGIGPPE